MPSINRSVVISDDPDPWLTQAASSPMPMRTPRRLGALRRIRSIRPNSPSRLSFIAVG
jgi:hypothetical protein